MVKRKIWVKALILGAFAAILVAIVFIVLPSNSGSEPIPKTIHLTPNCPVATAKGEQRVWIMSGCNDEITELSYGGRVLESEKIPHALSQLESIIKWGGDLWIATGTTYINGSLVEINATTGRYVRTIEGKQYGFVSPSMLVGFGNELFVANEELGHESITEVNVGSGRLIRNIVGTQYGFDFTCLFGPSCMVASGRDLWIANSLNNSLTEINASNGNLVRVLAKPNYGFDHPVSVALFGGDLWVSNDGSGTLTEIRCSTGSLMRVVRGGNREDLGDPIAISGSRMFLGTGGAGVIEMDPATGAVIRAVNGSNPAREVVTEVITVGDAVWLTDSTNEILYEYKVSAL